jgi:hypothetical protein
MPQVTAYGKCPHCSVRILVSIEHRQFYRCPWCEKVGYFTELEMDKLPKWIADTEPR